MEKAILAAWVTGLGLLTWRELQLSPWRPPPPGRYAAASGLYVLLGLTANWQPAAGPAAMVAWGFDLALLLQVLPETVARSTKAKGKTTETSTKTGAQTA
jgi:hypothetical protein